jgi:hypothetical protein
MQRCYSRNDVDGKRASCSAQGYRRYGCNSGMWFAWWRLMWVQQVS